MGKTGLTIIFFFIFCHTIMAQDPHFSQISKSVYYINPAVISINLSGTAGLIYRNQWPSLKSFVTYGVFYGQPVKNLNSAFSFTLLHDVQGDGAIVKTNPGISYAYTVKLSDLVNLSGGIGLSYVLKTINNDKLVFESDITSGGNYIYGDDKMLKKGYLDFSLGLVTSIGKNFFSGISLAHVTKPNASISNNNAGKINYLLSVFSTGILRLNSSYEKELSLKPGLQFSVNKGYNELIYGSSLKADVFEFGIWARNDINFHFESFIFKIGFSRDSYNFCYSYDVNLKKIEFFSLGMGAHEVTFLYNFKYKEKRRAVYNKRRKI